MPQIGSIYVPDEALGTPQPAAARPGFFATLGAQSENTLSQLRYGLPYAVGQATGQLTKEDQAGYAQKLQEAAKAVAPYQPASVSDVWQGKAGLGDFVKSNLAALIPQAVGMVAGGVAGGAAGGPGGAVAGAVLAGAPGFVGQNVQSTVQEHGGLSQEQAERSLLAAPFQAGAAEAAGYMTPGLGRFLGSSSEAYTGNLGMRIGKSMLATGASQAAAGAAMEAGTQFASGDLGYNPDSAGKLVDAAVGGLAIGGLLGAFGGIKKTPVDTAKLPQPDDMAEQANNIVNGRSTIEPQPFVPAGLLPPPTNFIADSEGNVVPAGPGADRDLTIQRNLPVQSAEPPGPLLPGLGQVQSRVDDILSQSRPAAPEPPLGSQASLRGLLGFAQPGEVALPTAPEAAAPPAVEAPAGVETATPRAEPLLADADKPLIQPPSAADLQPDAERPFSGAALADLEKASKSKGALPELADHVARETALRQGELTGAVPTDEDTFKARLDEAKSGLRGSWVKGLDASDPQDLLNKVFTEVFDNQSEASSTRRLAQRLGILDDKLNPTPWVADALKARDDAEQAKIAAERAAAKAPPEKPMDNSQGLVKAAEPAAPEPQKSAAPEPAKVAEPAAPEEAPNKPITQGSVDLDPVTRLNTMIDALRSSEGGKAAITKTEADELRDLVSAKKFDEAHKRMGEILSAKENGELTQGPPDQEPAARRRRTREEAETPKGEPLPIDKEADADENAREIERVKAIEDARAEAEAPNEPIESSAPPAERPAEPEGTIPNEPVQQAEPPKTQAQATAVKAGKVEEAAKPKFEADRAAPLRQGIEDLRKPVGTGYKGLTDGQAQALHNLVDKGKYDAVQAKLEQLSSNRDRAAELAARKPIETDAQPPLDDKHSGVADESLVKGLDGKSAADAARYLADNAPSRYHRSVFDAVSKLAERLEAPKWKSEVKIVREGDRVPTALTPTGTAGLAEAATAPDGTRKLTVYLKDPNLAGHRGVNYITAGHELLHAVTMDALNNAMRGRAGNARLGALVNDLNDLRNAVIKYANKRIADEKAGKIQLEGFEKSALKGGNNSMENIHELLAYGLTHPEMQEYLQSIPYKQGTSVFRGLVNSVRKLLGLGDNAETATALTELMRISDDVLRPDRDQIGAYRGPNLGRSTLAESIGTPEKAEASVGEASKTLSDALSKIDLRTAGGVWNGTKKALLYAASTNHIVRMFGDALPGVREYMAAHEQRGAVREFLQNMGSQAYVKFEKLSPDAQARIRDIMGKATEFGVDPTKAFEDHTWLDNKALRTTGLTRERVEQIHKEVTDSYNTLRRQDGGAGAAVYDEFGRMNRMQALQQLAQSFHAAVSRDEMLQGSPLAQMENPLKQFVRESKSADTTAGVKFFEDTVNAQIKAATDYLKATRGEIGQLGVREAANLKAVLDPLDHIVKGAQGVLKGLDQAPYFHLGRYGDYFGTAEITKGEDGFAKPEAQAAVSKALSDAGINFVSMSADNRQPRFMIRFDNEGQKAAFDIMARKLAAAGHIDPETLKSGPRDVSGNFGLNAGTATLISRINKELDASPLFTERPGMSKDDILDMERQRQATKNMIADVWLNAQPDTAIARVMARRETRPGYDADMVRSWMTRWQVGSNAMANLSTMPDLEGAFAKMGSTYKDALHLPVDGKRSADPQDALNVMRELQLREAKIPTNPLADKFDKARGYASTYYLGANPAYMLMQMMQVGTNGLPELAKMHGFAKSFSAIRAATGDATAIMRAIMQEMGPLPLLKKSDALSVSENVLNNAKISPELRTFLTHMAASGSIDIGSMARAAQQTGGIRNEALTSQFGKHAQMVSHMAAIPASAMEIYSRLIVALAAQKLHGDFSLEAQQYAAKSVNESLFRYQSWNTGRAFTKQGILGRATPIVAQFMSYSVQMIEKLHGEMVDAFAGARDGESAADVADRKAAARKFLIGHTAGVTALAGTMGMPFATALAAVLDKSVRASGITGQKDWDATAAYRDFLSSVLGKDVGEVVAHGLPRAIGMDVSGHIGEGGLLPMTDLLASKRSWKDAIGDEASRAGAMPSMLGNLAAGGAQMADGHVLQGMITLLPTALKNFAKTYQMSEKGYLDSKGEKLPMSPTASAYLSQLLGYTPSQKAEYMEAKGDQNERKDILQARAGAIRQDLINAALQGDPAGAQAALHRATAFDKANVGFAITPTLGRALEKTLQQRSLAVGTQSPIGTPIRDVAGQTLTRYANVNYQQ